VCEILLSQGDAYKTYCLLQSDSFDIISTRINDVTSHETKPFSQRYNYAFISDCTLSQLRSSSLPTNFRTLVNIKLYDKKFCDDSTSRFLKVQISSTFSQSAFTGFVKFPK
jgi:hypothetical protein